MTEKSPLLKIHRKLERAAHKATLPEGLDPGHIMVFIVYLESEGFRSFDQVKPQHIRHFLTRLFLCGVEEARNCAYYHSLKAFFEWAIPEGLLKVSPMEGVEAPGVEPLLIESQKPRPQNWGLSVDGKVARRPRRE